MVFQRFSVSSGTYYALNNRLFPLMAQRISTVADIRTPRISGVGISPTDMSEDARILFVILALCHTVRVEREVESVDPAGESTGKSMKDSESRGKVLKKLNLIKDMKLRKGPPRRHASIMRRASAMQSAEVAFSSLRRGKAVLKTNYDYQVGFFVVGFLIFTYQEVV